MTTSQTHTTEKTGKTWSIIGMVFAVVALVLFPIVFGPIGAACGLIGHAKGDRPRGGYVCLAAIVATVIGFLLSYLVWSNR